MAEKKNEKTKDTAGEAHKQHKKRVDKAWQNRSNWDGLYSDALEFAIPYRRPASKAGRGANNVERVFDNTAIVSSFRSAGQLHKDLFPPGQASFRLVPGPLLKMAAEANGGDKSAIADAQQLEKITKIVAAFFMVPEFDTASNEMCIDLMVGTGTLLPLQGDSKRPVRWVCIPFDECAISIDAYGAVVLLSWKTKLPRREIMSVWPDGTYPDDFKNKHNSAPDEDIEIWQDWWLDRKTEKWRFASYVEKSEVPIHEESYRTQPLAVPRYYRVPGEAQGRGPILLALPTIKVLNKAVELTLKAAAIQMLGIWGYRPGGNFNPESVRIGPGQFWPMSSTGGVLGPEVTRLDAAAGRIDVSQLVTRELRIQVQAALQDENLPAEGATPRSAREIVERIKRTAQNYLGAFGRLVNEIHPVIVRRVIEILYDLNMLEQEIDIDTLLVDIEVLSPIAAALKSQALQVIIEFAELVLAIRGEAGLDLLMKVDDALRHVGSTMGVPPEFIMTGDEQKDLERKIENAVATYVAAQQEQQAAAAPTAQPAA